MAIAAILGAVVPLIPTVAALIRGSEDSVGGGRGELKKTLVVEALRPLFKHLQDEGKIPADFDVAVIGSLVQSVFDRSGLSKPEAGREFEPGIAYPIQGTVTFPKHTP